MKVSVNPIILKRKTTESLIMMADTKKQLRHARLNVSKQRLTATEAVCCHHFDMKVAKHKLTLVKMETQIFS